MRLLKNRLGSNCKLELALSNPPTIAADRGKLVQVITNLLINALQALEEVQGEHLVSVRTEATLDQILVSLGGPSPEVIVTARHIRERAELGEKVPVVVFCIEEICEGGELAIGQNVYVTRPDNFNQLRNLLARLLHKIPKAA